MQITKIIVSVLFAVLTIGAGIIHIVHPAVYYPFIPDFLPKDLVNYVVGVLEIAIGVGIAVPRFRSRGVFGFFLLMIAFLPLHIIDVFSAHPAIGSPSLALIRLPLQFALIGAAWWVYK